MDRSLTGRERALIDHMLSVDFPGVDELRRQVEHVRVSTEHSGSPAIDLDVDKTRAPRADVADGLVVEAPARKPWDSDDYIRVFLFANDGWMNLLEVDYYEKMPTEFPSVSDLDAPQPGVGSPGETPVDRPPETEG